MLLMILQKTMICLKKKLFKIIVRILQLMNRMRLKSLLYIWIILIGWTKHQNVLVRSKNKVSVVLVGHLHHLDFWLIDFASILVDKLKQDYHHKKCSIVTMRI